MKYFIDYLLDINSFPDYHGQDEDDFCNENRKKYDAEYNEARKLISKKALAILERHEFFHDWIIESVTYRNSENKRKDKLIISIGVYNYGKPLTDRYVLEFYKVSDFTAVLSNDVDSFVWGMEEFYCVEILPASEKRISFELLSPSGSTLFFKCGGIKIRRNDN